ncbi:MAG: hypothetical protein QM779_17845 [Propionicimonas sp.]|uniref:hypothetical protein n=1 Tax=Propionicimonas sp. TaxID=1955623 RepID=UPI003D109037
MPVHVLIAHVAALVGPVSSALVVVYALVPAARARLRWPMVVTSLVTGVLFVVTASAGRALLADLDQTGVDVNAAYRHAKFSDTATTLAVVSAILVPVAALRPLRPGVGRGPSTRVWAVLLCVLAVGLLVITGYTVLMAVGAAWGADA